MSEKLKGLAGISYVNARERAWLRDLLPEDGLMLEIGTADGVTIAWLAKERPRAMFVSVDTFPDHCEGVRGNFDAWRQNARSNQALWIGTAQAMAEVMPCAIFDLTLVDGEHTKESCAKDLRAAAILTQPRGVIALHDYERPKNGVKAAFAGWTEGWVIEKIIGSTAILVHSEGKEIEAKLKALGYE